MTRDVRMPVVFFGHGNPMHAIQDNATTRIWGALGLTWPRPRAILCISAHWYTRGTRVTAMAQPQTIHDFGGFPEALHAVEYPAPGDPAFAQRVRDLLAPAAVSPSQDWGLDHGSWAVLRHLYPQADVPVVQLSIDRTQPGAVHYDLGHALGPLRDEGVLIVGSGNIVHNLHAYAWGLHTVEPHDWATRFEEQVCVQVVAREHEPLVEYQQLGEDALQAVPTPEHYLPLLYVLGASREDDVASFPVRGIEGGSVSMLTIALRPPD